MSEMFDRSINSALLRQQAEGGASADNFEPGRLSQALLTQLHELHVSQIELEIQSLALTELQRQKDEVESGLNHYAQLYELAPASYFSIGRDGRISRANVAAAALLRLAKPALLGKKFEQFVAPEAQGRLRRFIAEVFDSGARQVLEVALFDGLRAGGQVRIEANVDPDSERCRMIVTDLGDQDARASALRRAFVILDTIKEGVLVTDGANRIMSVNPSFTAITGYLAEEAIGRDPGFLGSGAQPASFFSAMWRELGRSGAWQGEILNRRKDGSRFVEWLSITQMRAPDGGAGHFVGVFSDITERKLAEASRQELHRELDRRVSLRTGELVRANQLLLEEIGEREKAEGALRDAEHFFHAAIDSLSDRVLVLDHSGTIVHANKSCVDFAGHNGIGTLYLRHCETDARWQRGAGIALAAGIRGVIQGVFPSFALEYEFHTCWFLVTVRRFLDEGPLRVVVSHTDISERKAMEGALRESHAQLRQLAIHLETAKEDERKRISRDIHDELGQNLLALRIDISMLSARTAQSHPRLNQRVASVLCNVDATIKNVRGIMNDLRPMVLDLGLQAALEWQIGDFGKRGGITCSLRADDALFARISGEISIVLFRIVQEALSNVLRHAQARHVEIELCETGGHLYLLIGDDGVGIAPAQRKKVQCFGLIGIAERISGLGGQFEISQFAEGRGCRLHISIPLVPG
ncbi:PAS domain S-box-containing protein [Oxalobacteraceae bacterium GrIS 1.11]